MVTMENWKMAEGIQNTWKGELRGSRQMDEAKVGEKMIQYSDCRSTQSTSA